MCLTFVFVLLHLRVDNALKQVYAELTRTALLSGSAYLSLQDPEEPYLSGISFTAMPPAKRWRSMDQVRVVSVLNNKTDTTISYTAKQAIALQPVQGRLWDYFS